MGCHFLQCAILCKTQCYWHSPSRLSLYRFSEVESHASKAHMANCGHLSTFEWPLDIEKPSRAC